MKNALSSAAVHGSPIGESRGSVPVAGGSTVAAGACVCVIPPCCACSDWTAAIAEARAISTTASRVSSAPVVVAIVVCAVAASGTAGATVSKLPG
jgi:hypothetical protein